MIFVYIIIISIQVVMFVYQMSSTLSTISKENRKVHHLVPCFLFIPIIGYMVLLYTVNRLNQSLKLEFKFLNINSNPEKPTLYFGILSCLLGIPFTIGQNKVFDLLGILSLVFLILYWIRISRFQKMIIAKNV